ncbi:protein of unknown function [Pseudomonas mediterranea]
MHQSHGEKTFKDGDILTNDFTLALMNSLKQLIQDFCSEYRHFTSP